jgi:tyrosinase
MRRRKNQAALTEDGWCRLVDALKCLQDDKGSRNWDYFTELHAKYSFHDNDHGLPHGAEGGLSIHSPVYWLPWHRKFILEFEERLREIDDSIELPYWNWTRYREIPEPLTKKIGGWMQVPRAVFHDGDRLPSVTELNQVMAADSFESFDDLLVSLHNGVHVWVGGAMGDPARSPRDPLFFLHHCFLDKVWADWQEVHHPSLFPDSYREMALPPWNDTVDDVLSITRLEYAVGPQK